MPHGSIPLKIRILYNKNCESSSVLCLQEQANQTVPDDLMQLAMQVRSHDPLQLHYHLYTECFIQKVSL